VGKLQLSVAMGDYDRTRALLPTLEAFARHHHVQGLSSRLMAVDEIFHPATYESFKI
jgi:hypothetical protein